MDSANAGNTRGAVGEHRLLSRRGFLRTLSAAGAFTVAPGHVLGAAGKTPPSGKINMAFVGVGWQGIYNLEVYLQHPDVQVVAVCDVNADGPYLGRGRAGREVGRRKVDDYYGGKGCAGYADFREMLDARDDIDAVVITTPDHSHAVQAMAAFEKGHHVFCEKPLAHSVFEVRSMTEAARAAKVATQMGNWGHAKVDNRWICEWIWDGAIGQVREVHAWTNRPGGWWPYGIDRPKDEPPVPEGLDWDLWLGPAPERPYHPAYLPFTWRGWWDFGGGALGDMGCHILDPVVWALRLGSPQTVEASSTKLNSAATPFGAEMAAGAVHPESTTQSAIVRWHFPARDDLAPVDLTWYDGGLLPPRPSELEPGRRMGDRDGGVIFVGDKGKLMCGCYGDSPRLIPESRMKAYKKPPSTLPPSIGHYKEFVEACKGGAPAGANFDYAGPLTEIVSLGIAAIRADTKLEWDPAKMEFPNHPDANRFARPPFREGWEV